MLDNTLLAAESFLGEGIREDTTYTTVVLKIGINNVRGSAFVVEVEVPILDNGLLAVGAVAVYSLLSVYSNEGDLIGREADGRAVLIVEGLEYVLPPAAKLVADLEPGRDGVVFGARDLGQRVQVGIV